MEKSDSYSCYKKKLGTDPYTVKHNLVISFVTKMELCIPVLKSIKLKKIFHTVYLFDQ
jgi:hypothetical protein